MTNASSSLGKRFLRILNAGCMIGGLIGFLLAGHPVFGQGTIERIRQDVRNYGNDDSSSSPASETDDSGGHSHPHSGNDDCDDSDGLCCEAVFKLSFFAITSPFWAPIAILEDDYSVARSFGRYPYEDRLGYMTLDSDKRWAAQFSADYATEFNDLDFIGGRLLVETASRWGLDTEMKYLQERLPRGARDSLWLGDCNLTYRFAQNENMQWRTGLGVNWMDDPRQTDYGFNFTYGFDWFPRRPWVASMTIDWGTLGHAGLFHFRGTVGAMFNRIEAYTGYEYYDFNHVQTNALIGGVRIWF